MQNFNCISCSKDFYLQDLSTGTLTIDSEPEILKEAVATAFVDGQNLLGPVVGNFCMDLAIKKAKSVGIGLVVAQKSNHYGIAGHFSMQALNHNMIGMSFTNTTPIVFPTRSNNRSLGTNALSLAAPTTNKKDSFVLDMATSTVAMGKVEINKMKGVPLPNTWGADSTGRV